jgi:hypothetical protein
VYMKEGVRWVWDEPIENVYTRHFPELKPAFKGEG